MNFLKNLAAKVNRKVAVASGLGLCSLASFAEGSDTGSNVSDIGGLLTYLQGEVESFMGDAWPVIATIAGVAFGIFFVIVAIKLIKRVLNRA